MFAIVSLPEISQEPKRLRRASDIRASNLNPLVTVSAISDKSDIFTRKYTRLTLRVSRIRRVANGESVKQHRKHERKLSLTTKYV